MDAFVLRRCSEADQRGEAHLTRRVTPASPWLPPRTRGLRHSPTGCSGPTIAVGAEHKIGDRRRACRSRRTSRWRAAAANGRWSRCGDPRPGPSRPRHNQGAGDNPDRADIPDAQAKVHAVRQERGLMGEQVQVHVDVGGNRNPGGAAGCVAGSHDGGASFRRGSLLLDRMCAALTETQRDDDASGVGDFRQVPDQASSLMCFAPPM